MEIEEHGFMDSEVIALESMFRRNIVMGLAMTMPLKMALDELARTKRVPVSVMVRNMFIDYFFEREPNFREIYLRHLHEQSERIKQGDNDT